MYLTSHYTFVVLNYLGPCGQSLPGVQAQCFRSRWPVLPAPPHQLNLRSEYMFAPPIYFRRNRHLSEMLINHASPFMYHVLLRIGTPTALQIS